MLVRLECLVQESVTFSLEMPTMSLWSCTVVWLSWSIEKTVSGLETEGAGHGPQGNHYGGAILSRVPVGTSHHTFS